MKKITLLFLLTFINITIIFSSSAIAVIKLDNGNYMYSPQEVNDIRKTIEIYDIENKNLKQLNQLQKEKYEALLKLKSDNSIDQIQYMKESLSSIVKLYDKLIANYELRLDNLSTIVDNKTEQFKLSEQKVADWKDVADKLNAKSQSYKRSSDFWKTTSTVLGIGILGLAVSK